MKMDQREYEKLNESVEAKKKELITANREAANALLLRMLSALAPEIESISLGEDFHE